MVRLIVFDFHGTLSLKSGKTNAVFSMLFERNVEEKKVAENKDVWIGINDLKNLLRKVKTKDMTWYNAMHKINIDPDVMMPTLDEVIYFTEYMRDLYPIIVFSVASMLEDEAFIFELLTYCFEKRGKRSPFEMRSIVSSASLKDTPLKPLNAYDKTSHIDVILRRNNLVDVEKKDIVLIDDNTEVVQYMASTNICCITATNYFTIQDWNRGCYPN